MPKREEMSVSEYNALMMEDAYRALLHKLDEIEDKTNEIYNAAGEIREYARKMREEGKKKGANRL